MKKKIQKKTYKIKLLFSFIEIQKNKKNKSYDYSKTYLLDLIPLFS